MRNVKNVVFVIYKSKSYKRAVFVFFFFFMNLKIRSHFIFSMNFHKQHFQYFPMKSQINNDFVMFLNENTDNQLSHCFFYEIKNIKNFLIFLHEISDKQFFHYFFVNKVMQCPKWASVLQLESYCTFYHNSVMCNLQNIVKGTFLSFGKTLDTEPTSKHSHGNLFKLLGHWVLSYFTPTTNFSNYSGKDLHPPHKI